MPSVTPLSFKASFTAKGMTLVIPPGWLKPTEGKTPALSSLKNRLCLRNKGRYAQNLRKIDLEKYKDLKVWKWMESPTARNRAKSKQIEQIKIIKILFDFE